VTSPELLAAVDRELRLHPLDASARARVVLQIVRRCYDTVKFMVGADLDTDERFSLGKLVDAAYEHEELCQAPSASLPAPAVPMAPPSVPPTVAYQESPEQLRRSFGSYDPHEPMVIPYADLIAARNAVGYLARYMNSPYVADDDHHRVSVRLGVRTAVLPDDQHDQSEFATNAEAAKWLTELRDRLTRLLPTPPSGPMN
jgi:hypothetical protein